MSRRKIIIRVTLILITLAALFVLVGVPWFFTSVVTTRRFDFPDSGLGKTPTLHQLAFDERCGANQSTLGPIIRAATSTTEDYYYLQVDLLNDQVTLIEC